MHNYVNNLFKKHPLTKTTVLGLELDDLSASLLLTTKLEMFASENISNALK